MQNDVGLQYLFTSMAFLMFGFSLVLLMRWQLAFPGQPIPVIGWFLPDAIAPGGHVGDISSAIQDVAEGAGFSLVREFVGHGIGRSLHEDPQVPNYRTGARGVRLQEGLVLAIEPMVNLGGPEVYVKDDGWTAATRDGKLSAHFEHSVAVTADGPYILSLP